jgi:hypothetical protein
MKRLCLLLVVMIVLAGCAENASPGEWQCHQGICVKIEVDEPIVWEEPIIVRVTVTTEEDVSDVGVSLRYYGKDIVVEEPETEEPGQVTWQGGNGIDWKVDTKSDQPVVFARKMHIPLIDEGVIWFFADIMTPGGLFENDSLGVYFAHQEGKVYYSGTPLPITPRVFVTYDPKTTLTITDWPTTTPTIIRTLTPIPTETPQQKRSPTPIQTQNPYPIETPKSLVPTPTLEPYP